MSKGRGQEAFRKEIYGKMTETGYIQPYETFIARNSDPNSDKVEDLMIALRRKGVYDGNLEDFKEQFYGVKKKETPSETSASGSGSDYVGTAGVVEDGSTLEKRLSSFNIVREGQELTQGKKETTLSQIRQMRTERPDQTIVQVKDEKGKPTLRYLDEHKEIIKKKAFRVPDAATLEAKPVDEAVLDFYSNKPAYVDMVEERRSRGFENSYNKGKFVSEGIREMQTNVRDAIDLKVKEIGKPVLDQYLNLNKALKETPQDSPEYAKMMGDYEKFNQAHPDLQEYEGLVNRFWALEEKNKEARKDPNFKGYFDNQAKKEQAQINADLWSMSKLSNDPTRNNPLLPAATKEVYDLGAGLVRAAAGIERFITGKKYGNLDFALENFEQVADPALYSSTATPSNRTKLVGQQYAEVGDFKVLIEDGKAMGVVSKDGGYQLRDQNKAQEVIAEFERTKPKVKTQVLNPYTATDVVVGGAVQMATSLTAAGIGAKIGQAGSIASSIASKSASIAANAVGTYNKLYISAIQELGPSNQKAAERYAMISSLAMSSLGTLINPLEQQLLNVGSRQAIRTLARELGEGVAEQTAVRSAVRSLMEFGKSALKEGVIEGATEALVDDAIKFGVNKNMLKKGENNLKIDLPQDLLDNVAEETIGGLFGSVAASLNPSTFQVESLENAYRSPNRAQILSKLDKDARKHYETVFAKADVNTEKSILQIHQEELVKARTGEDYVAPPITTDQAADTRPPESGSQDTTRPNSTPIREKGFEEVVSIISDALGEDDKKEVDDLIAKGVRDMYSRREELTNSGMTRAEAEAQTQQEWLNTPNGKRYQELASKAQNTTNQSTPNTTTTALNLAATLDPKEGDKITTPMGQSGTIVGFDIDEDDEEETPRFYKVRMDESGEETLISIADYNKNIYERGIQDLQSQGMSRNEAEFAVEAARSVKDLSQVQPDASNMVDQSPDTMEDPDVVEDAVVEPVDQAQTDQLISEPEPTPEATVQPISEPVVTEPTQESVVFDEPYKDNPRQDGKKFYRLEDGKIEVLEKADGTASVSVIGDENPRLDSQREGKTYEYKIEDFDNVEDAKKYAIEVFNQRAQNAKQESNQEPTSESITKPKTKSFTDASVINREQAKIDKKLGSKQGKKYFDQAMKLINPNENEIVEFRPTGVVTKDGDKYTLHAFGDTDMKNWRVAMKLDVTDQFTSEPLEERTTTEDIELLNKLTDKPKSTLRENLEDLAEKIKKSLKKYGEINVVFYDTNQEIAKARMEISGEYKQVIGFYDPKTKTIHVSLQTGNPTHTLLHEAMHVFMRSVDEASFNKLFEELISIPEYTQALKTKSRSVKEHAAMYPERWQKEEALVEYFAAVASGEIEVKKDSKIIEILNNLLKLLGLKKVVDNTNIRFIAQGLATALREGIEIEQADVRGNNEIADEILVDFPYYDKVTKLVENGINKGVAKDQIVQTILSAYNSQNISVPQSLIEAIYTSRTAIRKKRSKPVGKLRTAFSNFHQKYFVANGGGEIREMVERLEGTVQRTVDEVQSLIKLAEKQSKDVDQNLVDRYLRDENSLPEKQDIVDTLLRPNNVSEELIEKYLRGGTTRYQRLQAVKELDPNVDWTSFVESRMNDQDKALIPVNLAATLTTMRQSLDNLSSYLVDEGYVVGDRTEVILENLGQYMSDVYGIFKDKKFKPSVAARVKARKYFIEQIRNDANKLTALSATGNDLEEEIFKEAERMINDYITKSKQPKGSSQGAPVAKKSEAIFKQKEGVPDELKELLGKYSPLQEYAYTMFNLVNYVEKSKFQRRMVNLGKGVFMWDRNDPARPVDANYQLKGFASDKLKGDTNPFKGMMSDQATFEVLAGLDQLFFNGGPILAKFLKFQGLVNKNKTVFSYQTHFGNILGNFFFMSFNGMVDASTVTSLTMAGKATGRDLFGRYGLKKDEVDEVLTILKNEQVIGQDVSVMAIRETVGDLEKTRTPSDNPFVRGLQKVRDAGVWADKGLTNVYQAEDNFFKVLAYMTERKRYAQALYGKPFDQLDSIQKEEVNRIATEIAKANWPNYGRMGKFTQMAAKNNILFGNFLSFTFEAMRTYGNTIAQATRELKSDNPGVKFIGGKRMVGIVAGSIAADAALMTMAKTASGIFALMFASDDKTKLNRDLRLGVPKFLQGGDLMFSDKGNGQYEVIDISAKNPLGIFRRHFNSAFFAPTDQEIASAIARQFLDSFLDQSIAVKYTQAITKNKDENDRPIYLKTDTGFEAAEKIFAYTLKQIGPAAVNSAMKVGKSDDPLVTLGVQVSGHNVYKIDFSSTWGKLVKDYTENIRGLKQELRKVANDEDATDSEYQTALAKFNKKKEKELKRLSKLKQSMLNVGLPDNAIGEEMKTLNNDDERTINTGRFIKNNISRKELIYD